MTWEELKKSLDNIPEENLHEPALFDGIETIRLIQMTGPNTALDITERKRTETIVVGKAKIVVSWFPKAP